MSSSSSESERASATALGLVLQNLSQSLVYTEVSNVETNRKLWNQYAKNWSPSTHAVTTSGLPDDMLSPATVSRNEEAKASAAASAAVAAAIEAAHRPDWLAKMADQVSKPVSSIKCLGDEWSDDHSLQQALDEFLFPFVNANTVAAEIGVGGGRIASRVSPRVKNLVAFDISEEMLKRAKTALTGFENVQLNLLTAAKLPDKYTNGFDFVYSFDVFPHLDLHTIHAYFGEIKRVLKHDGFAFLHTANLAAPLGWDRFVVQSKYTAGGFYFMTPETISILAARHGFTIVKTSTIPSAPHAGGANMYYARDYLFVLRHSVAPLPSAKPLISTAPAPVAIDVPSVTNVHSFPAGPTTAPSAATSSSSPSPPSTTASPAAPSV